MNQYTVLLVDDEEEVFQVIMKKLDWESMGFSIAGYARNGVEALEMAEELQPDVVMTQISRCHIWTDLHSAKSSKNSTRK